MCININDLVFQVVVLNTGKLDENKVCNGGKFSSVKLRRDLQMSLNVGKVK